MTRNPCDVAYAEVLNNKYVRKGTEQSLTFDVLMTKTV